MNKENALTAGRPMFVAAHEAMSHFYAPGHSARELDRLSPQARMYEPFARQLFRETGLLPGMLVLDVGCGSGDVALLARELVGPTRLPNIGPHRLRGQRRQEELPVVLHREGLRKIAGI